MDKKIIAIFVAIIAIATTSIVIACIAMGNTHFSENPFSANTVYVNYTARQTNYGENAGDGWLYQEGISVVVYISSSHNVTLDLSKFCLKDDNQFIQSDNHRSEDIIEIPDEMSTPSGPWIFKFTANGNRFDYELVYTDSSVNVVFNNQTT